MEKNEKNEFFENFKIKQYELNEKLIKGFIIGIYNDKIKKMEVSFKFPSNLIFYEDTFNVRKKTIIIKKNS